MVPQDFDYPSLPYIVIIILSTISLMLYFTFLWLFWFVLLIYLFKDIYFFLERGKGRRKRGRETSCVVASCMPPTGDLACNPGMCTDWELNRRPFGLQVCAQSTEPHQPGCGLYFLIPLPLSPSLPTPLSSGNHQSALCVCESVSVLFLCLFCSLDYTCKWNHMVLVWLISLSIMPTRSIHAVTDGKISFFFMTE